MLTNAVNLSIKLTKPSVVVVVNWWSMDSGGSFHYGRTPFELLQAHIEGSSWGSPPTGARVTVTGIDILRVANGRIQERWGEVDVLGLRRQLGIINAP